GGLVPVGRLSTHELAHLFLASFATLFRQGRHTQDPLGFDAGDSNLYRYVANTPTIIIDPSGLQFPGRSLEPPDSDPRGGWFGNHRHVLRGKPRGVLNGALNEWYKEASVNEKQRPENGSWTQEDVKKILKNAVGGRAVLAALDSKDLMVYRVEFIRYEF